ncbi:MAG: hypothetical protein RJAPGHWK_000759 [Candidatus Fervidibacter sp.]
MTLVTTAMTIVFIFALYWAQRQRYSAGSDQRRLSPEYMVKRDLVSALQDLRGKRPFSQQEFELLQKLLTDSDWRIRCRALDALRYGKFQNREQYEKAVKATIKCLQDTEWVVHSYALRTLAGLSAKEAIPFILPLLNDPKIEVREDAKAVLKKWGATIKRGDP